MKKTIKKNASSQEKTMSFLPENGVYEKVIFFFPDEKELSVDRSFLFQNLVTDTLFVPAKNGIDAYECLFLATYKYQDYLSKKKKYDFEIFLSQEEEKQVIKKIPLYEAII